MRRITCLRTLLLSATAVSLAGCANYASVSTRKPRFAAIEKPANACTPVEQCIISALKIGKRDALTSLGKLLTAAEASAQELARNPKDDAARDRYNFAVSRIVGLVAEAKLDPWSQPLRIPAEGGEYVLTHKKDPRKLWNPSLYDLTPADQFDVKGSYVTKRALKSGLGAPIVVVGKTIRADARELVAMPRAYYGVTAVARFNGKRCEIAFEDPLAAETTKLANQTFPLGADFTVPVAVMLAQENPKKLELARLLRPGKFAETARIARLQPYDPNKTVVIVTHGLMDSPATWAPMLIGLREDPVVRQKFQFWFYSYPSGYPYPYSAAIMREQLDAAQKRYPLKKKAVLIGHSMGGIISRLMITDSGNTLWSSYFKTPPDQTPLSPKTKATMESVLIFNHRSEVGRAIFIAAPHRGSDLASNWLGRIGSSLVKSPSTLIRMGQETLQVLGSDSSSVRMNRIPNSVDTLSPNNKFVVAVNTIPITSGIPYHSIIGDRGKGGNKDKTKPISSDGFVPYWSSHLDGATSELVIPSNHSAHQHPAAVTEVRRILREHANR